MKNLVFTYLNDPSLKDINPEKSFDKWYFKAKIQIHY